MFSLFRKHKDHAPATTDRPSFFAYETKGAVLSDVGCVRQVNEDRGCLQQNGQSALMIVADGMGGHAAGEVASSLAIEVIHRAYVEEPKPSEGTLENAFHAANRAIYQAARDDLTQQGMGTTCTALMLRDGLAYSAHVGDSRLYLVRAGQIYLMSEDHSAVMEMVRQGALTLRDARHHEDKNVILRALGTQPNVAVSVWDKPFPVQAGDAFVICSDGLYDLVEDDDIKQAVLNLEPPQACEHLIALALQHGGHDNVTVGVLRVQAREMVTIRSLQPTCELPVAH
jgi:PPM family protein phosphatase